MTHRTELVCRDYIHVVDLAKGHVKAVQKLEDNSGLSIYNLGTGKGYSVLDIVKNFEAATGVKIPYCDQASSCQAILQPAIPMQPKLEKELGWKAEYDIKDMCADSWRLPVRRTRMVMKTDLYHIIILNKKHPGRTL